MLLDNGEERVFEGYTVPEVVNGTQVADCDAGKPISNADLEPRLTDAFEELIDAYSEYETPDHRTAAYTIALDHNATAHAYRGLFP